MDEGRESNLRLLAPVALAVFVFLLVVVVLGSGAFSGIGFGSGSSPSARQAADRSTSQHGRHRRGALQGTYTVHAGDTLGSIARRNGTTVERLQELNPQIDPEALTAGQEMRVRE